MLATHPAQEEAKVRHAIRCPINIDKHGRTGRGVDVDAVGPIHVCAQNPEDVQGGIGSIERDLRGGVAPILNGRSAIHGSMSVVLQLILLTYRRSRFLT